MTLSTSMISLGLAVSATIGAPQPGATLILEKIAISGHVPVEYSFQKACQVYGEGHVTSRISLGNSSGGSDTTELSRKVRQKKIRKLRSLIALAKEGAISETRAPCDIGTQSLRGHVGGEAVEIDVTIDCDAHRVNQSAAAVQVRALAKELCRF